MNVNSSRHEPIPYGYRLDLEGSRKPEHVYIDEAEAASLEQIEMSALANSIEEFCRKIQSVHEDATCEQKRQLVELLIDRVVVFDEQVEIRYVIPTEPDGPHVPFCQLYAAYRIDVW